MRRASLLVFLLPLLLCASATAQQRNVLLIIGDDMGIDRVGAYASVPDPGNTPRLDALAAQGMLFTRAYANPVCSPTRATMLTGRYSFRNGIGLAMNYLLDTFEMPATEVCLPQALGPDIRSVIVGKWHMSALAVGGLMHPMLVGFERHLGSITVLDGFISNAYSAFMKNIDGVEVFTTKYNTTDTVDDTLEQIAGFGEDPWCIWVSFNAPHAPFHKPPANLHTFTLPPLNVSTIPIHMKAMTEAMDTEIGRLLDSMDPDVLVNTVVIFIGDNGTDKPAASPPLNPEKVKGTLYEGGIQVPLIIAGPDIAPGTTCHGLVNSTDLFATIADIWGRPAPTATDSVSLLPYFADPAQPSLRSFAYAERFAPNGYGPYTARMRSAREERFKLIWNYTGTDTPSSAELYDLHLDPTESVNLLLSPPLTPEADAAHAELVAVLVEQKLLWAPQGFGMEGTAGIPELTGSGELLPGTPVSLVLSGARPNAPASLFMGFSFIKANFKGGVLFPAPDLAFSGLVTDELGSLVLVGTWPAEVPPDVNLYHQFWILDPEGPLGFAASNAVRCSTP